MIKSILGGKSKNLFDISKVITSNVVKRNGNSLICSSYGTSIGTLGSICPTLKASDLITISFKCASEGAPSNFMAFDGRTFPSGATFLVSEIGLSTPWYLYNTNYEHRDIPNKTTYSDIQVELGSTATEYVPHELTSYKSIMKVSDVCQLANSKLFTPMNGDTVILEGVSITKNIEAGTITFNGTSTGDFWYHVHDYSSELRYTNLIKGYKYYISGMPVNDLGVVFQLTNLFNLQGEQIFTAPTTSNGTGAFDIYVPKGVTLTDFVVTPQLFNLTEMYKAGNEPKTVAEFKAKFPNDYYPYSPSCFVTSFDERMPCKTKNLLNINANSEKGYYDEQGNFYPTDRFLCFTIDVISNNTYCISTSKFGSVKGIVSFWNNNIFVSAVNYGEQTVFAYTVPSGANKLKFVIEANQKYSNIQLEKGTTATDYVPYGYV